MKRAMYVTGINWAQEACVLVDADGQPVKVGQTVTNFRGQTAKVEGGVAPHKSNSEGFVVTSRGESYAGVYGLRWVHHLEVLG